MIIKNMFAKPIDRDIKGVIKVGQDDDKNVQQELEEYVVTKELLKHFSDFFSNYKKSIIGTTDKVGVWIAGFFGSGKSHFLKILSYLLENREVNGKKAIDYFTEDNKIQDPMIMADIKLASDVPTDVVLFNIDSKSDVSRNQTRASIVSVMQNVFNEMQGFSGLNPWLADLERNLSHEGKYNLFKEEFEKSFCTSWEDARDDFDFIQDIVIDVLDKIHFMTPESGRNFCEKSTKDYNYRIESFVKLVKEYLDQKGKDQHIVFMIDEVGQYIGDDSNLMLELQTIEENLGTVCHGKAWLVVTSQQDVDSITKIKGDDFSKIQGRFDTRLSLSSLNVDEVIKKRILKKNEPATQTLSLLYDNKETVIKNLILFNDGIEKKLYANRFDFAEIYPFIPYQFDLLGSALTAIRIHGASGKHLAEGERSMLALFKESAVKVMNEEPGRLVPFYMFYDSLEQFLDHSHKGVVARAFANEHLNPEEISGYFDISVLKTLFLIKYVKEIKANAENITSLMVSNVDDDRLELLSKVNGALNRLVKQTLVQKNNDNYVFLTNEEQEINRAIEAENIELSEVMVKVSELIFDDLYDEKKYKHPAFNGRYVFAFNQVVDDVPYKSNQNNEIELHIMTPNNGDNSETTIRMMSTQKNGVFVVLPSDRTFLDELNSALKIEKYLRHDSANIITKHAEIKESKKTEMNERKADAKLFLSESLKKADVYVNGDKIQSTAKDIDARINEAMSKLVDIVFHKHYYIDTATSESDIRNLLKRNRQQISIDEDKNHYNKLALQEVNDFIALNTQRHVKTSMKTLLERFLKAPYGFIEADVQWIVAKLFKEGEIALNINNETITLLTKTEEEIIRYLTRRENYERLMTEKRTKANETQKRVVKDIMKSLFHVSSISDDEDDIMESFRGYTDKLKDELNRLEVYYNQQAKYPGKEVVSDGKKLLIDILQLRTANEFFEEIYNKKDDYLNFAKDFDLIEKFFAGAQKQIFDNSLYLIDIYDDSKTFIINEEIENLVSEIKDILTKNSPYNDIYKLPTFNAEFNKLYNNLLLTGRKPVDEAIQQAMDRVFSELKGKQCEKKLNKSFIGKFEEIKEKVNRCNNIADLHTIKSEVDALKIRCLDDIEKEEAKMSAETGENDGNEVIEPVKKPKTISIKSINTSATWQIRDEEDVERYVSELERKLKSELEEGIILNIEF